MLIDTEQTKTACVSAQHLLPGPASPKNEQVKQSRTSPSSSPPLRLFSGLPMLCEREFRGRLCSIKYQPTCVRSTEPHSRRQRHEKYRERNSRVIFVCKFIYDSLILIAVLWFIQRIVIHGPRTHSIVQAETQFQIGNLLLHTHGILGLVHQRTVNMKEW
jgi:hypothetical protein